MKQVNLNQIVTFIDNPEAIEKICDLDPGYGRLLAGKDVKIIEQKGEQEYDIELEGFGIIYDVVLCDSVLG